MTEPITHTILVLDDDPIGRALVVSVLQEENHTVVGTDDGAQAGDWIRSEAQGILLADLLLGALEPVAQKGKEVVPEQVAPGDGYAILIQDRPDLPRVCLRDSAGEAVPLALLGYVRKPVNPETLIERIGSLQIPARQKPGKAKEPFPEPPPPVPISRSIPEEPPAEDVDTEFLVSEIATGELEAPAEATIDEKAFETPVEEPAAGAPPAPSPWAPSPPEEAPAPAFEALPRALRTALLVDSDSDYRQFLRGLLEPAGFVLYEAENGEEALKHALARRPWLILTEVNLPVVDGFEFCRRVRSHSLLRHTPLVFLAAWDEYRERYHGLSLGADDYLSKQTDARELLIRLQIILKRYAEVGVRSRKGAAMEGGIELIGAPGMLQMCHLSRFTGVLTVRSGTGRVQIRLRDGELLSAESNQAVGAEAIFDFLAWSRGHFEFVPGDPGEGEPLPEKFDYLLLEGCRRLDEGQRDLDLRSEAGAPEA